MIWKIIKIILHPLFFLTFILFEAIRHWWKFRNVPTLEEEMKRLEAERRQRELDKRKPKIYVISRD